MTIATQNGYVATLRDRRNLRDFARPKTDMLRLGSTQKRYLATIATQKGYVFARLSPTQKNILRFCCATQKRYVAILREQNYFRGSPGLISFGRPNPGCLCFDHVRPKKHFSIEFDREKFFRSRNI